jgi:tRNA 2-selenouridine synthase
MERLTGIIGRMRGGHSGEVIEGWLMMAGAGDFRGLAEGLIKAHYDPRYEKHRGRMGVPVAEIEAERLDEAGLDEVAARVVAAVSRLA